MVLSQNKQMSIYMGLITHLDLSQQDTVTSHLIVPYLRNNEQMVDIFFGTWATTSFPFITATASRSWKLSVSCLQVNTSPNVAVQISLNTWYPLITVSFQNTLTPSWLLNTKLAYKITVLNKIFLTATYTKNKTFKI